MPLQIWMSSISALYKDAIIRLAGNVPFPTRQQVYQGRSGDGRTKAFVATVFHSLSGTEIDIVPWISGTVGIFLSDDDAVIEEGVEPLRVHAVLGRHPIVDCKNLVSSILLYVTHDANSRGRYGGDVG
jgi:hypothetical protein